MNARSLHRQAFQSWQYLVDEERKILAVLKLFTEDSDAYRDLRWHALAAMNARIDAKNRFNELSAVVVAQERARELLAMDSAIDDERAEDQRWKARPTRVPKAKPKATTKRVAAQKPHRRNGSVDVIPRPMAADRCAPPPTTRWRDVPTAIEDAVPLVPVRHISEVRSASSHVMTRELNRIAEREFRDAPWRVRQRRRSRRYEGFSSCAGVSGGLA
jgi:hypothetical protein